MNLNFISKCKFVSKPFKWFLDGSECILDINSVSINSDNIIDFSGSFKGYTLIGGDDQIRFNNNGNEYNFLPKLPRLSTVNCKFSDFIIYDNSGNQITDFKLFL